MTQVQSFKGWVEKKLEPNQYSQEFVVTNYDSETTRQKMLQTFKDTKEYPMALKFTANVKNGTASKLTDVYEGDLVSVEYVVFGRSGVSKLSGKYYCINSLNVCKNNGITVLARAEHKDGGSDNLSQADDIPF